MCATSTRDCGDCALDAVSTAGNVLRADVVEVLWEVFRGCAGGCGGRKYTVLYAALYPGGRGDDLC